MKISELGEFPFIEQVTSSFPSPIIKTTGISGLGAGDDCAVIPMDKTRSLLVTTDILIEGKHFLLDKITPEELGYKSVAVNLSDIAAMGGSPHSLFLSIGIPPDTEETWLTRFFDGLRDCAFKYGTTLAGGDTSSADKLIINITALGEAPNDRIKYRSGAQPGDVIIATGNLGDSAAGLNLILNENLILDKNKTDYSSTEKTLIRRHHYPEPHINEGLFLSQFKETGAMIDISDGIASDLKHILKRSKLGSSKNLNAKINSNKLPLSPELQTLPQQDQLKYALTGGEDYVLLATIRKYAYKKMADLFEKEFSRPLTAIGEICEGDNSTDGKIYRDVNGKLVELELGGFSHF